MTPEPESAAEPAPFVLERPEDYEFEPELRGWPPREIPPEFFAFPYHQRRLNAHRALFTAAVICDVLSLIPAVDRVALFFLPLQYLFWIGVTLMAIGAVVFVANRMSVANLEYIRSGEAYVGRILDLAIAPGQIVNGVVSAWNYIARVAVWKPHSATPEVRDFVTSVSSTYKAKTRMLYRVGDPVTVVEVPGDKKRPMQLYGFLGVRPDIGLARTNDKAFTLLEIIAAVGGVFLFFAALIAAIVIVNLYSPIGNDEMGIWGAIVGAVVLGLPTCWFMFQRRRTKAQLEDERRQQAAARGEAVEFGTEISRFGFIVLLLGALMASAGIVVVGMMFINAAFDASKPEWRPVQVTGMYQVTHQFIVREYYLEYTLDPKDSKKKLYCAPWHMRKFIAPQGPAFAAVHKGFLGMPWVRTVEPWIPKE